MLDTLIRGCRFFDGMGSPSRICDVGIRDGHIASIDLDAGHAARQVVEGDQLWMLPGFIDIHTHYDLEVEVAPGLAESVRHGVTTVVIGNCSLSATIGHPTVLADLFRRVETLPEELISRWLAASAPRLDARAYVTLLRGLRLGPNLAALVGHSALRAEIMGLERSVHAYATDEELERLRVAATEALDAGCIGISLDMLGWHMMSGRFAGRALPSHHAAYREYAMLADVCRSRDAVFQITPDPQNLWSFLAILWLAIGAGTDAPLRMTVLAALDSVSNRHLWRLFPLVLRVVNGWCGGNLRFQTLTQPFEVFSDGPVTPLFEEFRCGVLLNDASSGRQRQLLWADARFRARFRQQWASGWRKTFHRDLAQMVVVTCPEERWNGWSFVAIAMALQQDALDTFMDLLARHDTRLRWVATGANDRLAQRLTLMGHRHILPGFTDAGAHVRNLGYYDGALSLLRQAHHHGFMSMERAVARVTGEAAAWFGLDVGRLHIGAQADFVLVDPRRLTQTIPPQHLVDDPVLAGGARVVKRDIPGAIVAVHIRGVPVVAHGEPLPRLGTTTTGQVLVQVQRDRDALRISPEIPHHPFSTYWDVFVLKHQHPANITLHVLGVALIYALVGVAGFRREPWWLVALPLSQMLGLLGHACFEPTHVDRRDAVLSLRAMRCLNRLFLAVLCGRYGRIRQEVRDRLKRYYRDQARERGAA